jgi:nitrate reductase NapE
LRLEFVRLAVPIQVHRARQQARLAYTVASLRESKQLIRGGQALEENDKKTEFRSFVLLVVILAPILSIAIVGGYGFVVWMSQLLLGAPGV